MVKRTKSIAKAFFKHLNQCADNTTFHGVKPIIESKRSVRERIWWAIAFVSCATFFIYFIARTFKEWNNSSVIMIRDTKPTPVSKVPFPAITICPGILFDKSDDELLKRFENLYEYLSNKSRPRKPPTFFNRTMMMDFMLLEPYVRYHSYDYVDFRALYKNISDYRLSPLIIKRLVEASFAGGDYIRIQSIFLRFIPILTEHGLCFSFNILPGMFSGNTAQEDYRFINANLDDSSVDGGHIYEMEADSAYTWTPEQAQKNPKKIYIYPRKFVCNKFDVCTYTFMRDILNMGALPLEFNGQYRIAFHAPTEYPTFKEYEIHTYTENVAYAIDTQFISTNDNLRSWKPDQRGCYFDNENPLKFFNVYSEHNCKLECIAKYHLNACNCTFFALPRSKNTTICSHRDFKCIDDFRSIDSIQLSTIRSSKECFKISKMTNQPEYQLRYELPKENDCLCLPSCVHYEYSVKLLNSSQLPNKFERNPRENFMYYTKLVINKETRTSLITFQKLLSDFGGLMGLFLGGSVLSLFEIGLICACCKRIAVDLEQDSEVEGEAVAQITNI